jgi:hypothetical protein
MRLGSKDFAIMKLNPSAVKVIDGVPYDKDDNVVSYDDDAVMIELNLQEVRMIRNAKLAETDWTQSRDITLTNDADWQTYRQALRDITDTYTSLDDVVWPEKPE